MGRRGKGRRGTKKLGRGRHCQGWLHKQHPAPRPQKKQLSWFGLPSVDTSLLSHYETQKHHQFLIRTFTELRKSEKRQYSFQSDACSSLLLNPLKIKHSTMSNTLPCSFTTVFLWSTLPQHSTVYKSIHALSVPCKTGVTKSFLTHTRSHEDK